MKDHSALKYECLDRFNHTVTNCKDNEASKLLIEMFNLIAYQMNQIKEQRIEIVGLKHKLIWSNKNI